MTRLIDADLLKENIIKCLKPLEPEEEMIDVNVALLSVLMEIDEQPTAFDVEKVTESLMNRFRVVSNDEDLEWNRAIDYAIKIVKGGEVE
jgi:hypothetical protein